MSSYTWGKTITDASSALSGFFSTSARDHYNRKLEKALSVFDVPHRLVGAFTYELPIGPGKRIANVKGPVGKIIGGWQVTGVLAYQTGTPIGVGVNNTLPLFNSRNLPDVVLGVDPTFPKKTSIRRATFYLMPPPSGLPLHLLTETLLPYFRTPETSIVTTKTSDS
ncbi:MAG: hypothetical protein WKF37_10075 [Bryobacteraceae bacterium]